MFVMLAGDNGCVCVQSELSRLEQSMADSRKQREKVLADYRAKANEKKEFAEKVDRRVSKVNASIV